MAVRFIVSVTKARAYIKLTGFNQWQGDLNVKSVRLCSNGELSADVGAHHANRIQVAGGRTYNSAMLIPSSKRIVHSVPTRSLSITFSRLLVALANNLWPCSFFATTMAFLGPSLSKAMVRHSIVAGPSH